MIPKECFCGNASLAHEAWSSRRASLMEVEPVSIRRIFHHYMKWEEVGAGMWRDITAEDRRTMLPQAIEFTSDASLYGRFMHRIIIEWPISCEQNLSDAGQNRRAWVGHAAACLAIHSPEYVTREAWGYLSQKQQDDANAQADQAIQKWLHERRDQAIHFQMGKAGLSQGYPGRSTRKIRDGGKGSELPIYLPRHSQKRHSPIEPRRLASSL